MLFDVYIVVDWSASAVPKRGKDSIWYAVLQRRDGRLRRTALQNPPTRVQAMDELEQRIEALLAGGRRVLVGFDFPNAYPQGFAARAGFNGAVPWRAVWDGLDELIDDSDSNANNRFQVAAALNARISGGAFPFWGCPPAAETATLRQKKQRRDDPLQERRLCEARVPSTQPCWKLYTTGSVGSQALLGIPMQRRLRDRFADSATVWPFETGLRPPPADRPLTIAEVYPSMVKVAPGDGEVKDALQVEALARHFAARDAEGRLAGDFAGPALSAAERRLVEIEEGWILGAGTFDAAPHKPVSQPAAIYDESFAIIRAEADFSRLPPDAEPLAVRLIHSCGMVDLVADLEVTPNLMASATAALRAGAPILCDVTMVASGVTRRLLPANNEVVCTLDKARADGGTRSAAAVDLWRDRLAGAIVAIGNAPTALFRLLELLRDGAPRPAAILGFPVGFVGAAESKQALRSAGLPFATVHGRRGGSAMAAAAVTAIAEACR
jgi:precorrin-8X/cobalt-precorrin-8 methylmutase